MKFHPYHIVTSSPWPLVASINIFFLAISGILVFYRFMDAKEMVLYAIGLVFVTVTVWFRDVIRESVYFKDHTKKVKDGLRFGFTLFIVSEIMFFFAFFWSYFHYSLSPSMEIGTEWPPAYIKIFNPYEVPLINTTILLLSGLTITIVHYKLINSNFEKIIFLKNSKFYIQWSRSRKIVRNYYLLTLLLALLFLYNQLYEYSVAPFNITDSVYGSIFFLATGFHGIHVLVGTIFILFMFVRFLIETPNFRKDKESVGFISAAWYWHFVDVVWIFLYVVIYLGSL